MSLDTIRNMFGSRQTLYECRHCGEKFDEEVEECPTCGAEETARYEF